MNVNRHMWLVATILGRRIATRAQRQVAVKGECAGVSKPAVWRSRRVWDRGAPGRSCRSRAEQEPSPGGVPGPPGNG